VLVDGHVDESVNVKVTVDLQQEISSYSQYLSFSLLSVDFLSCILCVNAGNVLAHSLPADALIWSPALRPLDRLLATNIEMARLQQELDDVELDGENGEKVKRPRNAFMFFCSNQRPQLQKYTILFTLCWPSTCISFL
jgi:hypothetical protein